jgi:Holliday junction resolvase RusA-like endonuclease
MIYNIKPVSKPRMTRADKWKQRPCVMNYRAFKDECNLKGVKLDNGDHITFVIPIAKGRLKEGLEGQPHTQRPDVDNLCKGLMDAILKEDSHIYDIRITKVWGLEGQIIIDKIDKIAPKKEYCTCGSDNISFDRTIPMTYYCDDCGKECK